MKNKLTLTALAAMAGFVGSASAQTTFNIDFDTDGNWTAGSGSITSYLSDHEYAQDGWTFVGGNLGTALRNTTSTQDGFAGAEGTYSWRIRDAANSSVTATYGNALAANEYFSSVSFNARQWDGSPAVEYTARYSTNGGSTFTTGLTLGGTGEAINSEFSTYTFNIANASNFTGLAANQFVFELIRDNGERLMFDTFSASTSLVPEPSSFALLAGMMAFTSIMLRRR